jgi:PAS domain S-box-containing protein
MVDDSRHRADQVLAELRGAGYQPVLTQVSNRKFMALELERAGWDVVLAGQETPGFGVLAALQLMIEMGIETPVVIISKSAPDERVVEAMRLGARDFVTIGDLSRLPAVVERELAASGAGPTDFREMFEASPLPLWVTDAETGKFLEVNYAAIVHYGYSRREFLSMSMTQIRPPEDVPFLMKVFRRHAPGLVYMGVWRHLKKDGTLIQVEIHVQNLTFRGRPARMAMAVDITDRWRQQQDVMIQARLAGLVSEIGIALARAQTLREGLRGSTEILQRHAETAGAQIWILNQAEGVLEMEAGTGSDSLSVRRVRVGESEVGQVAAERKPFARYHPDRPSSASNGCHEHARMEAFAGDPLIVEDRLVGVLAVYSARPLDRLATQALTSIAGALAQFVERKRTEEALRESDERTRLLLDSIAEAIYGVDLNGICTLANRACVEKLGYQHASELIGKNMHVLMHHSRSDGTPYPIADCRFFEAFRGAIVHFDDEALWRADGSSFPAACWSYPMRKAGQISGAVITFTDITERKHARDEQWKLASIVESSDDFIGFASAAGEVIYLNSGGRRMVGLSDAQPLSGIDIARFYMESMAPRLATEARSEVLRNGVWKGELQLRHWVTGAPIDVLANGFVVRDPKTGEVLCLAAIMRDITERKRTEEEQRKLASIVENSGDFIGIATPAGVILYINPGGCKMVGIDDPRDLVGKPISTVYPVSVHPWLQQELLPALMSEGRWEGETMMRNLQTGEVLDVWSRNFAVRHSETGEPICIASITRDIRKIKQVERDLVRARDAAEAGSRAKSEFLANMSHEIRTPMNGIIGMTELALQTDLDVEQRDYLESVRTSAEYLLAVINEVLDFSKIEAGKMSLDPSEFPLAVIIEETLRSISLRAHQKGLEMLCRIHPEVPEYILADSYRLRQILINLLGNAIKFTESGEILLEVKLVSRRDSDSEAVLQFSVSDTGPGIAPDKQQMVFQAFTQADGSMTRRYGGTGLGLAISRHLVLLMGGRMWLESEPGKGSTFSFTMQATQANPGESRHRAAILDEATRLLRGIRVLIVDDNATNRRILEQYVAQWGMLPVSASSAAVGLATLLSEKAAGREFTLVLLDACMPDEDGFSLARSIRNHSALAGAAIMMLSSNDLHADAQKCREAGIDVFLVKPVMQRDLRDAILRVLKTGAAPELHTLASNVAAAPPAAGLRVLLAEDNPVNQKLALRLLEKRGYIVTVAGDGARAVKEHAHQRFDLILMDLQMPDIGGLEATRMIRDREQGTGLHIPIVALTAHAFKGDRERCLEAGMDDYVSKPIAPDQLFETIERVTAGRVPLHAG